MKTMKTMTTWVLCMAIRILRLSLRQCHTAYTANLAFSTFAMPPLLRLHPCRMVPSAIEAPLHSPRPSRDRPRAPRIFAE